MTKAADTGKVIQFPIDLSQARDELNLCEFPMAVLSNRKPADRLELSFADKVWDQSRNDYVARRLRISAPPTYGLPTAKDEEVLLALIHLTDQVNRFQSPTVSFTRYELIKLLGWNDGGKSYQRIRESLARWKAVTLDYRNAWRDHKAQSWVSELFSIIDNVTIYDVDDQRGKRRGSSQLNLPLSTFTWNRIFFDSMQAKYFKRLDFGFYQRLRTQTAKRLFRFLDKRFGSGRRQWRFDLHEFAFEHIGLSRHYDTGQIKAKLAPAINELESEGYLEPMEAADRFTKHGKKWQVQFAKANPRKQQQSSPLIAELEQRGVSPKVAGELQRTYGAVQIRRQVEYFDWIQQKGDGCLTNPAGFLANSIREDFAAPAGFQTTEALQRAATLRDKLEAERRAEQARQNEIQQQHQTTRRLISERRAQLSATELGELEARAIAEADEESKRILADRGFRQIQLDLLIDDLILREFGLDASTS